MFGLKKKLMAAVAMLTVSAMMLTTASFAWFTISTNPEITGMTTTVVVNENLEIALANTTTGDNTTDTTATYAQGNGAASDYDSGDAYRYGSIIDLTKDGTTTASAGTAYAALDTTLRPATYNTTDKSFEYPVYGGDGRIDSFDDITTTTQVQDGFGNLIDDDGYVYGYYVDFWMRSNESGDVTLSAATKLSTGSTITGEGSTFTTTNKTLAENIAVSFASATTSAGITSATPTVMTKEVSGSDTYTVTLTGTATTLTANTDMFVRMYVYLEGATVTNAAASLLDGLVTGDLDVQFAMAEVTSSMDNPTYATQSST